MKDVKKKTAKKDEVVKMNSSFDELAGIGVQGNPAPKVKENN